ncbi:MAG: LysM peptidoglycan-binding domain-containing protein [Gordonia sp. (in: high G+C Gram-positive bacteria)]|uniref:LysM peptidoglycan-binding domain-containing protein n=1 Tax=Gordonia sp. (in: high G+C Gram-positive bacteria) TaxID=84139 RepID=UPI0039E2686B
MIDSGGCLTSGRSPQTHRTASRRGRSNVDGRTGTRADGAWPDGTRAHRVRADTIPPGGFRSPDRNGTGRRAAPAPRTRGASTAGPAAAEASARRRRAAGLLVGAGLAVVVAVMGVLGADYADAVTPGPAATEVVHVRTGETLSELAARIAPDQPESAVIAMVRELNGLETSGLRPGQALLVPARR